ncbi:MAG TPA: sensor histidine kinase [Thermomicrobiales bacterium]|nr:sensor histidine kinase [Thermomicrobiales bacterium]
MSNRPISRLQLSRKEPGMQSTGTQRHSQVPGASLVENVPLFYRVLLANVAIVVLGAVAGTYVTATTVLDQEAPTRFEMMLGFATAGAILSVAVNFFVLRAAFEPLDHLERLSESVRAGDLSARAKPIRVSDPQISRLVDTFNATLDELEQNQRRLRELVTQVINAQEGERKRIARELHDDTAQILFAQLLNITALKGSVDPAVQRAAESLEPMTVEAIEGVRRLALELRPPALDDLGVREAIAELAQRIAENSGLDVEVHTELSRERLPAEIELVLYRVAQEALTNAVKHAAARQVVVDLTRGEEGVLLVVSDDGRGFSVSDKGSRDEEGLGLGLFGMEERATLVGGTLNINSFPYRGTRVEMFVPLPFAMRAGTDSNPGNITHV